MALAGKNWAKAEDANVSVIAYIKALSFMKPPNINSIWSNLY
jgi:hypothetical protein